MELRGTAHLLATLNLARRQGLGSLRLEVGGLQGGDGDDGVWELTEGMTYLEPAAHPYLWLSSAVSATHKASIID